MATELYANVATTTVSSGGTTAPSGGSSESWTVASSTPFPVAATGVSQFHVSDPAQPTELVTVTNVSGTTWTVTRGAESTTPVAHAAGFTIWLVVTAADLTALATLASPALTGVPTAPTASALTSNTQLATTAYADSATGVEKSRAMAAEALLAPLASPALTGTPTAPTKTALTNNTDIATTAYADAAVAVEVSRAEAAEALALPLTGGTMSGAIAMGSHKITGLTNGSAASDVAAFGQLPVLSAADTSAVVAGTATAPTVRTATLDVIASQHAPAADWSNNSHKITSLLNGSSAQDAAAFGQIPLVDSTAANILPDGVQAAGGNGKWADSGHVHQNNADLTLLLAPSGATGETFPRGRATSVSSALASGTLYVCAIPLPKGLLVNNITLFTNTTVKTGGTHGWYVLLDNNRVVRAVTSDQTDAATVWGVASTPYTLSVAGSAYTTTYAGLYYIGVMVAESAGTMPTFTTAPGTATGIVAAAPILAGVSSVGQTTPPSTGTTMTTITFNGGYYLYAYTS